MVRGDDGTHHLLGEAFALAARAEAARAPRSTEHADAPEDVGRVLRAFVRDGRLTVDPGGARRSGSSCSTGWSQRFEPGRRYSENMVNLIIGQVHPDTAALRRYLVDEGMLDREARRVLAQRRHVLDRARDARIRCAPWHSSPSIATSARTSASAR